MAQPSRRSSSAVIVSRALSITSFTALFVLAPAREAHAQSPAFLERREDHIRRQEAILGYLAGVAGVSLAGGAALLLTDPPPFRGQPKELRTSFAMLNLIYGVANTAFVIANLAGLEGQRERLGTPRLLDWDRQRQARALAMNTGLDMIYITLGLSLWATDKRPIVQGMGLGIALQGAFLGGFDAAGALLMTR